MGLKLPKEKVFTGPASIFRRFFAFVIDLLVIDFIIIFPFRGILEKIMPKASYKEAYQFLLSNPGYNYLISVIMVVAGILSIFYFALLEYRLNQSIGKMFLGIFARNEMKEKRFWQYLVRSMFLLPVFPFVLLWIVDPIFMFFTKNNQRLSEILSKTKTEQGYLMG